MTSTGRVPFSFRAQFHVDANPVYRDLRRIFALLCHNFCCGEANNPLTPEQIREALSADGLLFDTGITRHGFTPYMRDYEVVVVVPRGSQHILKFSHCPFVEVVTTVRDDLWRCSWDDVFTDYSAWKAAGEPEGYVWGVCDSEAYPGPTYLEIPSSHRNGLHGWESLCTKFSSDRMHTTSAFCFMTCTLRSFKKAMRTKANTVL
jgi:hypothetical protein